MKKLSILLLFPLFMLFACSDDDNGKAEPKQDYTSFVFYTTEDVELPNCIIAYLDKDNNYKRIAELGILKQNIESREVVVENSNITDLYFFTTYMATSDELNRFDAVYKLKKNTKNIFKLDRNTTGILVDRDDPKQAPQ